MWLTGRLCGLSNSCIYVSCKTGVRIAYKKRSTFSRVLLSWLIQKNDFLLKKADNFYLDYTPLKWYADKFNNLCYNGKIILRQIMAMIIANQEYVCP